MQVPIFHFLTVCEVKTTLGSGKKNAFPQSFENSLESTVYSNTSKYNPMLSIDNRCHLISKHLFVNNCKYRWPIEEFKVYVKQQHPKLWKSYRALHSTTSINWWDWLTGLVGFGGFADIYISVGRICWHNYYSSARQELQEKWYW